MSLKRSLRAGLHGLGGYGLYHRLRNRDRLTVAMFHRVLPQADPRFAESDPAYTVSLARFEDYLDFFARHYAVVDYADLAGRRPLPPRPLLITFDDGWADTVEVALPALRRRGWNALVFVAGCAVGRARPFWQEELLGAVRGGRLTVERLAGAAAELLGERPPLPPGAGGLAAARSVVASLERLNWATVEDWVLALPELAGGGGAPAMADAESLRAVAATGTTIGAHGHSHRPLTRVAPEQELARARSILEPIAAAGPTGALDSFSFPHGLYDAAAVAAVRRDGYRFLFTSDAHLNAAEPGTLEQGLIGRIAVGGETATLPAPALPEGRLSSSERANWFFNRPPAP